MTTEQIVTIIALIVGPALAVGITLLAQYLSNIRNQRLWVFQTLMAYRSDQFNAERIKALALIDVFYRKVPVVLAKWKEYYDALNDPKYKDNPLAFEAWRRKQNEMLAEMAQALGYGRDIKYGEIDRVYAPIFFTNNALMAQKSAAEWLRVLEHSGISERRVKTATGRVRKRDSTARSRSCSQGNGLAAYSKAQGVIPT